MTAMDDADILLVEDNPNDMELILMALRRRHPAIKFLKARDGQEAMQFIGERMSVPGRPVRLILLDLKLPRVDGMQLLRLLKSDVRMRLIPVVVFSSSAEEVDVEEAYRTGANAYVQKPVESDKFINVMSGLSIFWLEVNIPPGTMVRSPADIVM